MDIFRKTLCSRPPPGISQQKLTQILIYMHYFLSLMNPSHISDTSHQLIKKKIDFWECEKSRRVIAAPFSASPELEQMLGVGARSLLR